MTLSDHIKRILYLSVFTAVGLSLFVFESLIPHPIPWLRLGLGNMAGLLALLMFGVKEAYLVTILRIFLGSLILGTFMSPVFLFALAGGIMAVTVMSSVYRFTSRFCSVVGISISGAVTHSLTQLFLAWALIVKQNEIFIFLWTFFLNGLVTGSITGYIALILNMRLQKRLNMP